MSKRWVGGIYRDGLCQGGPRQYGIQISNGITAGTCITTGEIWRIGGNCPVMPMHAPKSIAEIDFAALIKRQYTPSPDCWADQILYFLMLDRFSDGNEKGGYRDAQDQPVITGTTPCASSRDIGSVPYSQWLSEASGWQGGTLKGL